MVACLHHQVVFADGVLQLVHVQFFDVETVAEVVDTPASVALVRKCAGEPGIIIEGVAILVCAGRFWLEWSVGVAVVLNLRIMRDTGSVYRCGPVRQCRRRLRDRGCWGDWLGGWRREDPADRLLRPNPHASPQAGQRGRRVAGRRAVREDR